MNLPKPSVLVAAALAFGLLMFGLLVPPWVLPYHVRSNAYGPAAGSMGVYNDVTKPAAPLQPEVDPIPPMGGEPLAGEVLTNVQVLGDLAASEFNRTMDAITQWVAPEEGCGYCHGGDDLNFVTDNRRKSIAREMLRMTRTINANWTNHVGAQGVTCFTCHQGQNIPRERWYLDTPIVPPRGGITGQPRAWDTDAKTIRQFFPNRPQRMFMLQGLPITGQVQENEALVDGENPYGHNLDYAEQVYIVMMQMSEGLGVNCTYCHQSRALRDWAQSPPTRLRGYSGLRMTTALNQHVFSRLGPLTNPMHLGKAGDPPKITCKSCHNGRQQPAGGMLAGYYAGLIGPLPSGPGNPVAAANPDIPLLARTPRVGVPASVTEPPFRPIWEPD